MRRAILSVKTISHQSSTLSTNGHLESATPPATAANLLSNDICLAENNSPTVTGAEIKSPISQQKCESSTPCDSPSNLPFCLRGQTRTNKVKNHHYGPLGHFNGACECKMTMEDTWVPHRCDGNFEMFDCGSIWSVSKHSQVLNSSRLIRRRDTYCTRCPALALVVRRTPRGSVEWPPSTETPCCHTPCTRSSSPSARKQSGEETSRLSSGLSDCCTNRGRLDRTCI